MPDFTRKPMRLTSFDYAQNSAYFLTICTENRAPVLSDAVTLALTSAGECVTKVICSIGRETQGIHVDNYVVMPNHIHILISLITAPERPGIPMIVRWFKHETTLCLGKNIWQRSYFDHVVRDKTDYDIKWRYIDNNPPRWEYDRYNPAAAIIDVEDWE